MAAGSRREWCEQIKARGRLQTCDACGRRLTLADNSWQGVDVNGLEFLLCRGCFGTYSASPELAA